MSRLRIVGGTVHDPANGVDGEVRDICIEDGRIVADVPAGTPTLDARGMVVMPGGVDIHCHVASSSCNHARRLLPEEHAANPAPAPALDGGEPPARSGTGGTVPSTFTTGYRYAGLGYTTVFDAAVAPLTARHSHAEFDDTPIVDGGFFVLLGNDEYLLRQIDAGERDRARDYAAWLLGATGGYAIKIVNPGGVEAWKSGQRNVSGDSTTRWAVEPGDAARHPRDARRRGQRAPAARTRCTSTATTSACRATPRPRWRAWRRWPAGAPTSPTCSSTATAAAEGKPAGARRPRRSSST